ncbi:MAG: hypothetical protein ACHQTE_01745 [Candidatus Saccharimonadales bacterium]
MNTTRKLWVIVVGLATVACVLLAACVATTARTSSAAPMTVAPAAPVATTPAVATPKAAPAPVETSPPLAPTKQAVPSPQKGDAVPAPNPAVNKIQVTLPGCPGMSVSLGDGGIVVGDGMSLGEGGIFVSPPAFDPLAQPDKMDQMCASSANGDLGLKGLVPSKSLSPEAYRGAVDTFMNELCQQLTPSQKALVAQQYAQELKMDKDLVQAQQFMVKCDQ